jgi:hypothetical protein
MASSGTEEVATTDSIAQENEILQDAAANSNGKRGPKKSKLLVLDSTTVSFVPTETRQAMNSEGELVDIGGSQYSSQMCIAFWINWASEGLRALTTVGTSHANTLEAAAVSVTIKPKPKKKMQNAKEGRHHQQTRQRRRCCLRSDNQIDPRPYASCNGPHAVSGAAREECNRCPPTD